MTDRQRELIDLLARTGGARLERLCAMAVELVGVSGAAVIVMSDGEVGALAAAAGSPIGAVEDLQFSLGEGPCLESFRSGAASFDADIGSGSSPWPAFAAAASAAGTRAVFSLPLRVGAIRLGVLYLCRDRPGPLGAHQRRDAFVLADLATGLLLEVQSDAPVGNLGAGIGDELFGDRAAVHQATGMVSVQLGVSLASALGRLRAHAAGESRSIYAVAVDVIDRRVQFT